MVWKKGQSGNPDGLKRGKPVSDCLRAILSRKHGETIDCTASDTVAQHLAVNLILKALSGDKDSIKEVIDRAEGRPAQALIGDPDNPLEVVGKISWQQDQKSK